MMQPQMFLEVSSFTADLFLTVAFMMTLLVSVPPPITLSDGQLLTYLLTSPFHFLTRSILSSHFSFQLLFIASFSLPVKRIFWESMMLLFVVLSTPTPQVTYSFQYNQFLSFKLVIQMGTTSYYNFISLHKHCIFKNIHVKSVLHCLVIFFNN